MSDTTIAVTEKHGMQYSIKTWQLFFCLTLLNIIVAVVYDQFIMTKELYYNLLSIQMETYRIDEYFEFLKKMTVWGYLLIPLFLWLRITLAALLMQFPFLVLNIEIEFKDLFRTTTIAAFVYIIVSIVKIIWLKSIPVDQLSNELLEMVPFSITNLLRSTSYSKASFFLLKNVNIFEGIWIAIMIKRISQTGKVSIIDSVIAVFGVWFFIWLLQYGLVFYFTEIF